MKIAELDVPELVTLAELPDGPVVVVPTVIVAAAPEGPVLPVGPVGPGGPLGPVGPAGPVTGPEGVTLVIRPYESTVIIGIAVVLP